MCRTLLIEEQSLRRFDALKLLHKVAEGTIRVDGVRASTRTRRNAKEVLTRSHCCRTHLVTRHKWTSGTEVPSS